MSPLFLKCFRKDCRWSQYGSIKKLSLLIILAGCFIVLVTFLAGLALDRVKEKIQADVGDALQIVLQTTQESLNLWVESNKFQLTRLAEDPRLVSMTERQLSVPRNKDALIKSEAFTGIACIFPAPKKPVWAGWIFYHLPGFCQYRLHARWQPGGQKFDCQPGIGSPQPGISGPDRHGAAHMVRRLFELIF